MWPMSNNLLVIFITSDQDQSNITQAYTATNPNSISMQQQRRGGNNQQRIDIILLRNTKLPKASLEWSSGGNPSLLPSRLRPRARGNPIVKMRSLVNGMVTGHERWGLHLPLRTPRLIEAVDEETEWNALRTRHRWKLWREPFVRRSSVLGGGTRDPEYSE